MKVSFYIPFEGLLKSQKEIFLNYNGIYIKSDRLINLYNLKKPIFIFLWKSVSDILLKIDRHSWSYLQYCLLLEWINLLCRYFNILNLCQICTSKRKCILIFIKKKSNSIGMILKQYLWRFLICTASNFYFTLPIDDWNGSLIFILFNCPFMIRYYKLIIINKLIL